MRLILILAPVFLGAMALFAVSYWLTSRTEGPGARASYVKESQEESSEGLDEPMGPFSGRFYGRSTLAVCIDVDNSSHQ